jgi:hypothetical protein
LKVFVLFWFSYVRGENRRVEACPYRAPNLEIALGPENYFAVARADYRDDSSQARDDRKKKAHEVGANCL